MRILYFSRDYTPHDHRFLAALAKSTHRIYFLQLEHRGHSQEDRPLPPEVEQIRWKGGREPANLHHGPALLASLKQVIRAVRPHLIQAGPLQRSAFLAALSGFHPLLSMSWGYDLLVDAQRNSTWRWATRYTLKHTDLLLGDCETIRQRAISFGMPAERILTFPWGIDLQHFTPGDEPLSVGDPSPFMPGEGETPDDGCAAAFTLLSTRGWEPIYGIDILARGFALAARQSPELRLIMLGNGSMAAELRRIFLEGGVEERVQLPGQVSQGELPRYYRLAQLYISASHSDGSSISLLEAMACGRPALVSDIPGNREWVTPGENGWWFKDGNAQALAEALLMAVEKRRQLPVMGRAARRLVEQRADWEQNFPSLLEAYDKLLPGLN